MNPEGASGRGRGDVVTVLIAQGCMVVASLAVQSLLAWFLLPAGRGDYAVLAVVGTLAPALLTLGLDRSIQYQLMSGRIDLSDALGTLGLLLLACAGVSLILMAAAARWGYLTQLRGDPSAWALLGFLSLGSLAHAMTIRLHVAVRAYRHYLMANLIQSLLSIGVLVLVLGALGSDYTLAVGALAASYLLTSLVSVHWLSRNLRAPVGLVPRERIREVFGFGIRSYPTALAHAIDFNAGVLVLAVMAIASEVGIYAALSALMLRFLMLAQAMQEALLPRIAADSSGRQELVVQMSRLAVAATLLALAAFLPFATWLVALLLSPAFLAGMDIVWWLVPGIAAHAASAVLMPYFEGRGRPGVVSIATWAGMSTNVAGLLLLYPAMGLAGAGLAMTAGLISRLLILHAFFRRENGVAIRSLVVPVRADIQFAWSALRSMVRGIRAQ